MANKLETLLSQVLIHKAFYTVIQKKRMSLNSAFTGKYFCTILVD